MILSRDQERLEEVVKQVYRETAEQYKLLNSGDGPPYGFKILNGPPIFQTPLLFMGYQPGGGYGDQIRYADAEKTWPSRLDYLDGREILWNRIKALVSDDSILAQCVGMNSIYFRAPSDQCWKGQKPDTRRRLEEFCLSNTELIVNTMKPKFIVVIGRLTKSFIAGDAPWATAFEAGGRTLLQTGKVWNVPAASVIHLSGARLSATDRNELYQRLRELLPFDPAE